MAARYASARAAEAGLSEVEIDSAGTLGIEGSPASDHAITTLGELEIPLDEHRSRGLTQDDATAHDLIIVMTRAHLAEIRRRYPEIGTRAWLLREWDEESSDPRGDDLEDPIGLSLEAYRSTFEIIRRAVDNLIGELKTHHKLPPSPVKLGSGAAKRLLDRDRGEEGG